MCLTVSRFYHEIWCAINLPLESNCSLLYGISPFRINILHLWNRLFKHFFCRYVTWLTMITLNSNISLIRINTKFMNSKVLNVSLALTCWNCFLNSASLETSSHSNVSFCHWIDKNLLLREAIATFCLHKCIFRLKIEIAFLFETEANSPKYRSAGEKSNFQKQFYE